jgi:hypothetical protein
LLSGVLYSLFDNHLVDAYIKISNLRMKLQVFANPETQMGFHPDAGASFYLSRLHGYLGKIFCLI